MSSGPDRRRETFSRDDRLRKRREFEECYASGVRVSGRHLQLFFLPAGSPPPPGPRPGDAKPNSEPSRRATPAPTPRPRLGLSVPRRVGGAVARNRLRRRMREIFRRNRDLFGGRAGSVVINARSSAAQASFAELAEEYRALLARSFTRAPQKPRRP